MSCVLDASMTLSWLLPGEHERENDALFADVLANGAYVPTLWRLEIANVLLVNERRGKIDAAFRSKTLDDLRLLPIVIDEATNDVAWSTIVTLALAHELTTYDAAYLELSQRRALPLATLDRPLARAAVGLGIAVLGDASET